ncbi:Alkaline phosphatase synthesis transcriptional regulatory protein PhoP [Phycisphaerales bacterium]|nr:Alkaline phosphatase synthesis transcriptional regulatory protein PhoP [Phycisphaerales bacterium]
MSQRKHILVVDDETDLVELLSYNLKKAGYQVSAAFSGRQALERVATELPDLVVLDVMLPELSGTEVAGRLRSNPATANLPIVMLTAKGEDVDQIVGLAVGADDYIPKPFAMKVLMARIEAVLRRAARAGGEPRIMTMGGVSINLETHESFSDGELLKLTLTEFRLLSALLQANGRVLSRAALMSRAMGPGVMVTERTIDVHVTAIRKKLGAHAGIIKTVRGVGYRATPEPETEEAGESPPAALT